MNDEEVKKLLISIGACLEARKWAEGKTLAEIWDQCERIDWMFWLLGRMEGQEGWPDRKAIVLAACSFAELALSFVEVGKERPHQAIETIRAWARGDATIQEVKIARDDTYAADAADAAAYAAYTAAAAAAAAYTAAYNAAAYSAAAADAANAATHAKSKCIEIIRAQLRPQCI